MFEHPWPALKGPVFIGLNELFEGRQMPIKAFKESIFSTHSLPLPSDTNDDFDGVLTLDIQSVSSAIKLTQRKNVKILLQIHYCIDCLYYLHKYKLVIPLKIFWARLEKVVYHYIGKISHKRIRDMK